jgi:hypothetical protein
MMNHKTDMRGGDPTNFEEEILSQHYPRESEEKYENLSHDLNQVLSKYISHTQNCISTCSVTWLIYISVYN